MGASQKIIKVLGPGCANCRKLAENVRKAVEELQVPARVEKVTDIGAMTTYGILMTPALVVDEQVKLSGRVPSVEELKELLA
ncbi:MAG TPA: thioredoxin family protein [Planctomycetaceae bacterium]|nr:thioredoxin family protein [Planctomycetaceae bacterium]